MKQMLLHSADAAEILGVSPAMVRFLARLGRLPVFAETPRGARLFSLVDVEALRQERQARPGWRRGAALGDQHREAVRQALEAADRARSTQEITDALATAGVILKRGTVRAHLAALVEASRARRTGKGPAARYYPERGAAQGGATHDQRQAEPDKPPRGSAARGARSSSSHQGGSIGAADPDLGLDAPRAT